MRGEIFLRGIPASHFSSLKKMFRIFLRLKRDWMLHVRGGLGNVLLVQHSVKYFDRNHQDDLYIYILFRGVVRHQTNIFREILAGDRPP